MSRSKLKAIAPETAKPSRIKILIYGKAGVGKTWTALDFPACYYIDTEGGASLPHYTKKLKASGGVYFGVEQGSLSFENIIEQIKALATEKHSYKTVVIDSISELFDLEIAKEAARLKDKNIKNEFGLDKKPVVRVFRELLSWFQRIDMNVIIIAHEKGEWKDNEQVGVVADAHGKIDYKLHLILNIVKLPTKRNALVKKSRLEEFKDGDCFEWSYEEFTRHYGKLAIEKEVDQIVLATPEQILEFNTLTSAVKLPEGIQEKWLTAANSSSFEEMDSDKMQAVINMIKEKYMPKTNQPKENN